ncbi:MAG: hypothetical protein IIX61_09135 [Loktanella sp.]|nr:hypothetical protein [Loktanella sp.]
MQVTEENQASLKKVRTISRDRTLRHQEFQLLFPVDQCVYQGDILPEESEIWAKIALIVATIRIWPGKTVDDLSKTVDLLKCDIRQCIQIIVAIGGELEIICSEQKTGREVKFFLHN